MSGKHTRTYACSRTHICTHTLTQRQTHMRVRAHKASLALAVRERERGWGERERSERERERGAIERKEGGEKTEGRGRSVRDTERCEEIHSG